MLLAREKSRAAPAGVWLDGVIAGLGCELIQGYALSRPLPPENVPAFLGARHAGGDALVKR